MKGYEKSEAIKAGFRTGSQDGSSKMARRKCYGYDVTPRGVLIFISMCMRPLFLMSCS